MPITFTTARDVPESADVLAVPVFAGGHQPPGATVELDAPFLAARGFEGRAGQVQPLLADDGTTILAVGLGPEGDVDLDGLRRAGAAVVQASSKAASVATTLLDAAPVGADRGGAAQALAEGIVLGAHQFTAYKSSSSPNAVTDVVVIARAGAAVQKGLDRGARIGAAVALARDLVNRPARDMTPRHLEAVARQVAEDHGLTINVMDEVAIVNEGLGGLAGVAAGSEEPARLIELAYEPAGAKATVVLVGKGITFDSGGLSLKTGDGMMTMKCDMGGAAAVIAAMSAMTAVAPKVRVIGLAACTENLPSGKAIKPGDVLKIRNGKTVEVLNTDAEGRLVLADALSLAVEAGADAIVDLATLTGACIVALGKDIAGLMGNDDNLIEQVSSASAAGGRADLAPAVAEGVPQAHRFRGGRHQEHRHARCRRQPLGRPVPPGVRGRRPVGPPRHRRSGLPGRRRRVSGQGRDGVRRADPARVRGQLQEASPPLIRGVSGAGQPTATTNPILRWCRSWPPGSPAGAPTVRRQAPPARCTPPPRSPVRPCRRP